MTGVVLAEIADAGASAQEVADRWLECADVLERQITSLTDALVSVRQVQRRWAAGSDGERAVAQTVGKVIVRLGPDSWHLMVDRRWPGTTRANLDLLLVGPPGVVVIDAKRWAEPRVESGSLWNGQLCEDDVLAKLHAQADAVATALAGTGLAPPAITPMLALAGAHLPLIEVRGVQLVGELDLHRALIHLPSRLDPDDVHQLVDVLDDACPRAGRGRHGPTPQSAAPPAASPPADDPAVFTPDVLWAELIEAATREPLEAWMTWLHPAQNSIVSRVFTGPARIRGASGTGKSVVALHRARRLAHDPDARVLVTSFVRSLPMVQRHLFERLAPEQRERVEFRGLHAWALKVLRDRREPMLSIVTNGGRDVFHRAWRSCPESAVLVGIVASEDYWWDEERAVIRGRGLSSVDQYLALERVGRRTALREGPRRAMWALHQQYRRQLAAAGSWDWDDVIDAALRTVREHAIEPAYTSVIVDEVQDISCQGLRLLHALVGDHEDGLLLVGDGQQAVYAGGCTLSEAGISVPGARSLALSVNYRNRADILTAALAVVSDDAFDDLDGDPAPGQRDVDTARPGGAVRRGTFASHQALSAALIRDLTSAVANGMDPGGMAVLVRTNREARQWCDELVRAGVAAELLTDYEGLPTPGVKVGTYQRAKGLEFACVYIPGVDTAVPTQGGRESDDEYRERAELQRRQLFVAMTRARDALWLG